MEKFNPHIVVSPDGNFTPQVRAWSLEKYKLVGSYCDIFTTSMKDKWNQLIYIDLFAGAGFATVTETGKTYLSSSLIAMSIPNPFTKYILCEEDSERYQALKVRVKERFPHLDVTMINGDSNQIVNEVYSSIPKFSKGNTLLSFCFVDPFSLNLHFQTIQTLGIKLNMDFLILQALHMDANRNLVPYLKQENDKISLYLGDGNWRQEFHKSCKDNVRNFVKFLADQYANKMKCLGYLPEKNMHQIRSNEKNLPLYYLAFYSKHFKGVDLYKKVEKYTNDQLKFDL